MKQLGPAPAPAWTPCPCWRPPSARGSLPSRTPRRSGRAPVTPRIRSAAFLRRARLVAAQAARTPAAVAVRAPDGALTYADLNRRANALAAHLRGLGVGPETRVGVCLGRSAALVVGLLGIWKAGGAYVPLDPAWPRERLRYVIDDAALAVVLGDGTVGAPGGAAVVQVGPGGAGPWGEQAGNPTGEIASRAIGLRHLYLRLHRTAERRDDHARQPGKP